MSEPAPPAWRFEALYRANARPLLGYALRRAARPEDAADVVAETMLVAWRRIDDVPGGDEARLWLYGVARHVLANSRRGNRRRDRLGERLRHDASVEDIDGSYVVVWEPVPGQLVEVLTNGVDQAAALAVAENVRPATDAEWAEAQEQARNAPVPEYDDPFDDVPDNAVHRELADGSTEVWGYLGDERGLCIEVSLDGDVSSQMCEGGPGTTVLGESPRNEGGELFWDVKAAVGLAPAGTASIDGGEVTLGEEVEGGRLFVWEFFDGEMPDTLTFRDAAGNAIATLPVVVY